MRETSRDHLPLQDRYAEGAAHSPSDACTWGLA